MDTSQTQQLLLSHSLGGMFVLLTLIYSLGLTPRFAQRFYPEAPSFSHRLAAPIIFAVLSAACFAGAVLRVLIATVALGIALMLISRWKNRKHAPTEE